jgi:KDO2-lipid IV(A) lauroyltransferase
MPRKSKPPGFGRFIHGVRYRVGALALRFLVGILPFLPDRLVQFSMRLAARLTFFLLPVYRKRMEENLAASLGSDISAQEKKDLVWTAWLSFARGILDTIQVMHYSKECILSTVALEGEEHVRRALEQGKGVLALSAHLGSFTMIGARLAAAGFPFSVVVKQPADERFARLIDDYRAQIGIHTISARPRREAVRGILKALRRNRIVLVIADEFKSGDVTVDFLGLKVPAPRGPATLALRTGAITLPMFVTREQNDSLKLSVGPPIAPVECPDLEQSVIATTAVYTRCIEAAVRKTPGQWNWLGLPRRNGQLSRTEIRRRRRALGISRRDRRLAHGKSVTARLPKGD